MGKRGPKPAKPIAAVPVTRVKRAHVVPLREVRAERIATCVGLMRALRWETGVTGRSLAAEWGIPLATVEDYSAVASKLVRAELNPEDLKARVLVGLEGLAARADATGDYKTAGHMLSELARISGVDAPQRVDVRTQQVTIAEIVAAPDFVLPEKP